MEGVYKYSTYWCSYFNTRTISNYIPKPKVEGQVDNIYWVFEEGTGTLTISPVEGTDGSMPEFGCSDTPWYDYKDDIKTIIIEDGVSNIGDFAFGSCTNLTNITIPNSVTSIGYDAFYYCRSLKSVTIPNNVTSIGKSAFEYCTGLTNVTIGNSVTSIGEHAFAYCSSLASITIPDSVISIGDDAFSGTAWYKAQPDGIVYAGKVLYEYKGSMPTNTSIIVKEGTTVIADRAFSGYSNLASITIPNSVTNIGDYAFSGCTGLPEITCLAEVPPTIQSNTFNNIRRSIPLYVPEESVDLYKSATYWKEFTNIQPIGGLVTSTPMPEVDTYIPDNIDEYFKVIAIEDNSTVSLLTNTSPDLMYSLNETAWTQWDYSTIQLNNGDRLYLKGNSNGFSTSSSKYNNFSIKGKIELGGNIISLLYGDDFENNNTLPGTYTFYKLFYNCTGIVSAKDLILPATTLANYCYYYMFQNCTSLTTAPQLPATTLATFCYYGMFSGCTSLTTVPQLPATTLATFCYYDMFEGCTSLTEAPQLPATTLASNCYNSMFEGCTSLTEAPQLPATNLTNYCYDSMFEGCTGLTEAPELPATTLADSCYWSMFDGCTGLTKAPQLPATTLARSCYFYMFEGCTSLTEAPELPATTLAISCYGRMFEGCTKLNYIKALFTTTPSNTYTINWVSGVSNTGTFVKSKDATWDVAGTSGIPEGWVVETV